MDFEDYETLEKQLVAVITQVPLTWVPALVIALRNAKARGAFSVKGMSTLARRIEKEIDVTDYK